MGILRMAEEQERPKPQTAAEKAEIVRARQLMLGPRNKWAARLEGVASLTEAHGCGFPTRRG